MKVRRALGVLTVVAVSATSFSSVALAAWQAPSSAATANASATTMPTGSTPSASAIGSSVTVSWTASSLGGAPVPGYVVKAYDAATNTPRTVGASCAGTVTSTSCTESNVAAGTWRYTVTPTDASWSGGESAKSASVTVAGVDHFVVAAPSGATAGSAFDVTVTAKDASNVTLTSYRGTIHFTSSDALAGLPADYTFTAADNGAHVFGNATTLRTAGNQTVSAADTGQPTKTGSSTVSVSAAGLDHFAVTNPGTQVAGTAFTLTVSALDQYGNAASGWTGSQCVTFSGPSTSPSGNAPTYPAKGTCSSGSGLSFNTSGQATAAVTLYAAETPTLAVSASGKTGTTSFTMNPGSATKLAWANVSKSAGSLSSPCVFTCTVTGIGNFGTFTANVAVSDAYGNVVTNVGSGHTVIVTATGGGGFTAPTNGSSVSLTISATGAALSTQTFTFKTQNASWSSDTLTATSTGYASATATVTKN